MKAAKAVFNPKTSMNRAQAGGYLVMEKSSALMALHVPAMGDCRENWIECEIRTR